MSSEANFGQTFSRTKLTLLQPSMRRGANKYANSKIELTSLADLACFEMFINKQNYGFKPSHLVCRVLHLFPAVMFSEQGQCLAPII